MLDLISKKNFCLKKIYNAKKIFTGFSLCMEIRNNINTQNFNGIYKLKNSDIESLELVKDAIIPMYSHVKRRFALSFIGDNPAESAFVNASAIAAKSDGGSYEWLIQNAKSHGLKLPNRNNGDIWVLTGDDTEIIADSLSYSVREMERPNLRFKFKLIKEMLFGRFKDLPQHLKEYLPVAEMNNKFTTHFQDLLNGKKIDEVDNLQDLTYKMAVEK